MEIVALNQDMDDYDIKQIGDYSKVIYHYTYGSYEGYGELVAYTEDGKLDVIDLSHCSCYGPLERGGVYETLTVEEYIAKNTGSVLDGKPEIVAYLKANP
jgi:hypothetical protein